MLKKTERFLLSVYEYCIRAFLKARKEGILALEELIYDNCLLTETGVILFNKKIDGYIYLMIRCMTDGAYTLDINKKSLEKLSKLSSKKIKTALKIVSICMDYIYNGNNPSQMIYEVCGVTGTHDNKKFYDLLDKESERNAKDYEYKFTEEQKQRIFETDVYFRMKEYECNYILAQKNKELSELHAKVPQFRDQTVCVELQLQTPNYKHLEPLYWRKMPERNIYHDTELKKVHFIGETPVCNAMYDFWKKLKYYGLDIDTFMQLTDDVPENIEKYMTINTSMKLES